ncbi:site-specific integrase [bacterium]|nr:site-specific integrase [bacterium]
MTTVEPIRKINDLKKLEKVLKKNSLRDLVLFSFGVNTGLRISDILALNVKDIKNKNFFWIVEKKTNKNKKVPINKKLRMMLKTYTDSKNPDEPLFTSNKSNRLDRISAYRIIKKACKDCDIKVKAGTHTLRKTFGYHFYKKYNDILLLQKIFNHSSPTITLRYIGIEEERVFKSYMHFVI